MFTITAQGPLPHHCSELSHRGIRRFQLEVEPSQPVTLGGLSDSGSPVRLRFKTIQLQSGSSQCTPLHAALPPALRVCLCCTEVFFTFKKKRLCLKKNGIRTVMHFKTTDSPWACKKAGVCVTLIQAWTVGSPTSFEEVSLDSGPHGLRGTRQGLLTELWKPWCSCSPRGGLNTPGLEVDFFRTCVDTWNEMEDNAVAVRPTWERMQRSQPICCGGS